MHRATEWALLKKHVNFFVSDPNEWGMWEFTLLPSLHDEFPYFYSFFGRKSIWKWNPLRRFGRSYLLEQWFDRRAAPTPNMSSEQLPWYIINIFPQKRVYLWVWFPFLVRSCLLVSKTRDLFQGCFSYLFFKRNNTPISFHSTNSNVVCALAWRTRTRNELWISNFEHPFFDMSTSFLHPRKSS